MLMVLEPVFESRVSPKSHAFRSGRNAHTVTRTIRGNFAGYLWFLKGDLTELLDHVQPDVILNCVENVDRDKKILNLMKSALKHSGNQRIRCEVIMKSYVRGGRRRRQF